uniref:Uncharacterized protein n=1 Tax=Paraburkholderia sprentiae WSM5005 TaxID=754502 RepID=A0A1I9YUM8_9BURK
MRGQLGDARHQAGLMRGRLDALEATNAAYMDELETLRQNFSTVPASGVGIAGRSARRTGAARKPVLTVRKDRGVKESTE